MAGNLFLLSGVMILLCPKWDQYPIMKLKSEPLGTFSTHGVLYRSSP
jgi:hypothetical protein